MARLVGLCGLLLAWASWADVAATSNSIYRVIVDRNPFGLKDPPTNNPAAGAAAVAPPPVPANVKLAGITADSLGKRAWIVFTPPAARPGVPATNTTPMHFALREGDVQGDVRVVEIDPRSCTVKILNAGQLAMLDFTNNAPAAVAAPAAGPGGVPGAPRVVPAPIPAPGGAQPAIPRTIPAPPKTASVNPSAPLAQPGYPAAGSYAPADSGSAGSVAATGLRTIPSRPTRVVAQEAQPLPQVDPAVQAALMEQQQREAQARGEFLPPIPQ